jgi:hypothetical protein
MFSLIQHRTKLFYALEPMCLEPTSVRMTLQILKILSFISKFVETEIDHKGVDFPLQRREGR